MAKRIPVAFLAPAQAPATQPECLVGHKTELVKFGGLAVVVGAVQERVEVSPPRVPGVLVPAREPDLAVDNHGTPEAAACLVAHWALEVAALPDRQYLSRA